MISPMAGRVEGAAETISERYEQFRLREATKITLDLVRDYNEFFNDHEPWKTIKSNPDLAKYTIYQCLEGLRAIAFYIKPIIPNTSRTIEGMLNYDASQDNWDNAHEFKLIQDAPIGDLKILFTKLEDEQIDGELKRMEEMSAKAEKPIVAAPAPTNQKITIDDFKKIKLKTAVVVEAEKVPKSKKLLKLQITVGDEKRQIVAGIAEKYSPEELVGKTIVIVANLEPAKLMGIESQGMLLAVNDEKGVVTLVTPDSEALPGLEVR